MITIKRKRLERLLPCYKAPIIGIRLYAAPRAYLGIGDSMQFSSIPENYFRNTGQCLIDIDQHWIFDHNPYVIRIENAKQYCDKIIDLWQECDALKRNMRRPGAPTVYLSNAEVVLSMVLEKGITYLNRPRLYKYENYDFEKRQWILLHVSGRSNGDMPDYLIKHIIEKYKYTSYLIQIAGPKDKIVEGLHVIRPINPWAAAEVISKARMFIGPDSGLAWIAAAYPEVVVKKIRLTRPWGQVGNWDQWIPLQFRHAQSHWDDPGIFQLYNLEDTDHGIFKSWKRV